MKKLKISLLLFSLFLNSCSKKENLQKEDVKIGKEYLFCFDWDDENPFEVKDVDTVKVIALKGDYVQWQYKNGIKLSSKIRLFVRLSKSK